MNVKYFEGDWFHTTFYSVQKALAGLFGKGIKLWVVRPNTPYSVS